MSRAELRRQVIALSAAGLRNVDIEKKFGLPRATVSRWLRAAREPERTGVCGCGCGGATRMNAATFEPYRYIFGHQTRIADERLWREAENGCWVWQAALDVKGYGVINRDGFGRAHRWVYTRMVGPIPDGLTLDHLCCNKACVNPDHLEPVTFAENSRRRWEPYVDIAA